MPLIFLNYSKGAFTPEGKDQVANAVTRAAVELEGLPLNDYVLSTTWLYAREYQPQDVYNGGTSVTNAFVAIEINVINGGYSTTPKAELIKRVTDAVGKYGQLPAGEARRVYIVIREVAEANWGFDGQTIDLVTLRNPPSDAQPL